MRYFVEQHYYDNGKIKTRMLLESEVIGSGDINERYASAKPEIAYYEECDNYDLYVDVFTSYEEAEQFIKETAKA